MRRVQGASEGGCKKSICQIECRVLDKDSSELKPLVSMNSNVKEPLIAVEKEDQNDEEKSPNQVRIGQSQSLTI